MRHILETRRAALEAIAQRLIKVESIDASELRQLIQDNVPGPMVVPGTEERRGSGRPPSSSDSDANTGTERSSSG